MINSARGFVKVATGGVAFIAAGIALDRLLQRYSTPTPTPVDGDTTGHELPRKYHELQEQKAAAEHQLAQSESAKRELEVKYAEAQKQHAADQTKLDNELRSAKTQHDTDQTKLAEAKAHIDKFQEQKAAAEHQLAQSESAKRELEVKYAEAQKQHAADQNQIKSFGDQLQTTKQHGQQLQDSLDRSCKSLEDLQGQLGASKAEVAGLEAKIHDLKVAKAQFIKDAPNPEQLKQLEDTNQQLHNQLHEAQGQVTALTNKLREADHGAIDLRKQLDSSQAKVAELKDEMHRMHNATPDTVASPHLGPVEIIPWITAHPFLTAAGIAVVAAAAGYGAYKLYKHFYKPSSSAEVLPVAEETPVAEYAPKPSADNFARNSLGAVGFLSLVAFAAQYLFAIELGLILPGATMCISGLLAVMAPKKAVVQ
jgi:predicted  nucleic acid-binding Zn-ribbon protein